MKQGPQLGRGVLALAVTLVVTACSSASPSTSRQDVSATVTTAPATRVEATPTDEGAVDSISGSFEIVNTTEDGSAVGIEQIFTHVERRSKSGWQTVDAECTTDPVVPLVVEAEEVFTFECELADSQNASTNLRVIAEALIFGMTEPYRQVIELP